MSSLTTLYFIRHAEADNSVHDNRTRPLTERGLCDAAMLAETLCGTRFDRMYSSPYKRAVDTISPLAARLGLEIETVEDFRERRPAGVWVEDFMTFMERQWDDMTYKLPGGESLGEVQERFAAAIGKVIVEMEAPSQESAAIATHATALCAMLNYYNPSFGFEDFLKLVNVTPFVVRFEFEGGEFLHWELVALA